jgi:hypothetical protein
MVIRHVKKAAINNTANNLFIFFLPELLNDLTPNGPKKTLIYIFRNYTTFSCIKILEIKETATV